MIKAIPDNFFRLFLNNILKRLNLNPEIFDLSWWNNNVHRCNHFLNIYKSVFIKSILQKNLNKYNFMIQNVVQNLKSSIE